MNCVNIHGRKIWCNEELTEMPGLNFAVTIAEHAYGHALKRILHLSTDHASTFNALSLGCPKNVPNFDA